MGRVDILNREGLLNKSTDDFGVLALAGTPKIVYALCCGKVHYAVANKDNCDKCDSYLYWRNESKILADDIIEKYISRHRKRNNLELVMI